jgi:hypothetical protein
VTAVGTMGYAPPSCSVDVCSLRLMFTVSARRCFTC